MSVQDLIVEFLQAYLECRGSPIDFSASPPMPVPSHPSSYMEGGNISQEALNELRHGSMQPSSSLDIMEESTEVADTIYLRAGIQDLLDTNVFPKV